MPYGRKVRPVLDRFAARIALTDAGCIEWIGATTGLGYAQIKLGPADGKRLVYVHRWSYEHHVGPIPAGLTIDHICRNTLCVNPDHLEAVTQRVNILRSDSPSARNASKTHCIEGHPLSGENLVVRHQDDGRVWRSCRTCRRKRDLAHYYRNKKAA